MKQSHQSRRFNKLMKRERERMLNGKGVFRDAKRQLEGEAAEDFYRSRKPTRKRRKYGKTSHGAVSDWAEDTATMLYNRKQRRTNVETKSNTNRYRSNYN